MLAEDILRCLLLGLVILVAQLVGTDMTFELLFLDLFCLVQDLLTLLSHLDLALIAAALQHDDSFEDFFLQEWHCTYILPAMYH